MAWPKNRRCTTIRTGPRAHHGGLRGLHRGLILETASPDEPAVGLYSVTGTSFNTAIGRVAMAATIALPVAFPGIAMYMPNTMTGS